MNDSANATPPLKPVVLQILLALAGGDTHGYGVIRSVRERTDERIPLETGPFYRHLRKLIDDGLVVESDARPDDDDARRGAYYRITEEGKQAVRAEAVRLRGVMSLTEELGLAPEDRG